MRTRLPAALLAATLIAPVARAQPSTHSTCVDVQIGTAQAYQCLNQQLAESARAQKRFSSATDAPYSAASPPNVTGQFDEDATRQRLGGNFGHSATPARPETFPPAPFASARPH